jgi:hypothetical protein
MASNFRCVYCTLTPKRARVGKDMPLYTATAGCRRVPWVAVFWPFDHPMLPTCALAWQARRTPLPVRIRTKGMDRTSRQVVHFMYNTRSASMVKTESRHHWIEIRNIP